MRYIYTAFITPSEDGSKFYARVPDVAGCATAGRSLEDAIDQITDALSGCLAVAEDEGLPVAASTPQAELEHEAGDICTLIRVDTTAYRAATDMNIIYPAVFHHEDKAYWVEFPDLKGCQSFGNTVAEAFYGAKEALTAYCETILERGEKLPSASDIESISVPANAFPSLIEAEIDNK